MNLVLTAAILAVVALFSAEALERRNFGLDVSKLKGFKENLHRLRRFRDAAIPHLHEDRPKPPAFQPKPFERLEKTHTGNAVGCEPGWTGVNCMNPICSNETTPFLTHDGLNDGLGDVIEVDIGPQCQERFTFPIDFALPLDIYITVDSVSGGRPWSKLYDPNGQQIVACGDEIVSEEQTVQKYCNVRAENGEGLYSMTLQSDTQAACGFTVNAPTFLYPDGGFVLTPQSDVVQQFLPADNQAISAYPMEGTPYYFAFKMTHDVYPVSPQVIHIYQDGFWNVNLDLNARYYCATPHYTLETFNCTQRNYYHMKFRGIDEHGSQWQRVYDFDCDYPPYTGTYPTGAPPTMTPATSCHNDGVLSINGTCFCGPFFEGSQCDLKVCMNGGTLDFQNDQCICQSGYSGDFCQHVMCKNPRWDVNDMRSRALGFVIRSSQSMQAQMDQIVAAATNITNTFSTYYPDYFQAFVLSVVQNNAVLFTHEFQSYTDFISAIRSMTHPPTDTDCDDALLLGITEILDVPSFQKYPKSPIFIFSDGTANDGEDVRYALLNGLAHYRGQLFFMLSDSVTGRCNIALSDVGYQQMRGIAAFSQGQVIKVNLTDLPLAAVSLAETTYMMNELITNDLEDCRQTPKYNTFFVDESTSYLVISATGDKLSALVTSPNKTTFKPTQFYQAGNLYLWIVDTQDVTVGNYLLSISSLSSDKSVCQYRVTARSNYDLFVGITQAITSDETDTQPTWRQPAHLVAHINNVFNPDLLQMHAEVMITTNEAGGGRRQVVFASSGIYRDMCNFYLYFGQFTCRQPNTMFYIQVYMTDSLGHTLLRTTTGFCSASAPTVIPSDGCANGGVMYNGTCLCNPHYAGPKCQNVVCEHLGTPLFGACQCPAGFSGQFCEYPACNVKNNDYIFNLHRKSLSVLIHDSISTRSVMRTMNDSVSRVIEDIRFTHQEWITSYQLVRFNNTDHSAVADSTDPNDFINGMKSLAQRNYANSEISCLDLDIFGALFDVLQTHDISFGGIVYIFVNGVPKLDGSLLSKIYNHLEATKTSIYIVQTATSPCGMDLYDARSVALMSLAEFTSGMFTVSMANRAGDIFRSLPTLYSNQLITENYISDCTSPTTFYVPVDSLTQSFDVVINGDLIQDPVYTAPDNAKFTVVNLWSDIGYGSRGDQVIQPCDQGWDQYDNRCFKFGLSKVDWNTAALICHQEGASLASIFNAGDQAFLSYQAGNSIDYWIGLNDQQSVGTFVWDTPFNQSLKLDTTGYTNWAPNQPVKDPKKTCVFDSQSGTVGPNGWNAVDCGLYLSYVCQKHVYNQYYEPISANSDLMPRGIWKISIQTDEGGCSVAASAQSQLRVYTEYSADIHDDYGYHEPFQGDVDNRILAHVTGLLPSSTYSLEFAHFYQNNLTIIEAQRMYHRENCLFEYISSSFQCPYASFQMMLSGVDNYGYLYQRVVPVSCLGGPTPNSCENGGQFYRGRCVCPPNFYGEYCQTANCQNGGHITGALNTCDCRQGFTGRFCEIPMCTRGGNQPDMSEDSRTFVLITDGVQSGTYTNFLNTLNTILSSVLNDSINKQFPNWFANYIGIYFRNQNATGHVPVISDIITQSDPNEFIQSMQASQVPYSTAGSERSVYTAIVAALSTPLVKVRSTAFLVLNGVPDDSTDIDLAMDVISRTHTQINLLAFGDTHTPGNVTYDVLEPLFDTIHMSGGSVYFLKDETTFAAQWSSIALTLHYSYYLMSTSRRDCSNLDEYLQNGANASAIILDMFAEQQPAISVTDPKGKAVKPINTLVTNTNTLGVYAALNNPGIYTLGIDDGKNRSGGCLLNVRAQSTLDVLVAFTQDVEEDGGLHSSDAYLFPQAGLDQNAVVAAVNGGILQYVQMYDVEERRLRFAAPLIARANCQYPYISQSVFRCDRHSFTVAIDGLDFEGHPFRRMFTIHCVGFIPTRPPFTGTFPSGGFTFPTEPMLTTSPLPTYPSCDKSVPKIDIVIAFDSSQTITSEDFRVIVDQFYALGTAVTFGSNYTRVILGTYDSTAHFENQDFNTTTNITTYFSRIVELMYAGYQGADGNNVQSILNFLVGRNLTAPVTPFRTDARKLVMYFSTLGWDQGNYYDGQNHGYPDPTKEAQDLKTLNVEFYPIGYGSKANFTQLQAISQCARLAKTPYELQDAINYFYSIICSPTSVC